MTGTRKFRFGLWAMLVYVVAFAVGLASKIEPELFRAFAWGLNALVFLFVGGNAVEHIAARVDPAALLSRNVRPQSNT